MTERIAELEQQLEAWERRNRARTLGLALVPVAVAGSLVWFAESQIDRAEQGQAEALRRAETSEQALAGMRAELGQLRAMRAEHSRAEDELAAERERRARAEADLATARATLDEQSARALGLEQEAESLRARLAAAETALVEAKAQLAARSTEQEENAAGDGAAVARLQEQLARAQEEIAALRATGAEMDRAIATRDTALANLRRESEARSAETAQRVQALVAERDRLAAERDQAATDRDRLAGERDAARRAAQEAADRLAEADRARAAAEERADTLVGRLEIAEARTKESDGARAVAAEERERLQAERSSLEQQLAALKGELATALRTAALTPLVATSEEEPPPVGTRTPSPADTGSAMAGIEPSFVTGSRAVGVSPSPDPASLLADIRSSVAAAAGVEAVGDRLILGAAGLFAPGRAQLSPHGRAELEKVAQRLREAIAKLPAGTAWTLHVEGHTDDTPVRFSRFGSNQALSEARAEAVANHLIGAGLPSDRLVVTGLADRQPLVPGRTEEARSRNRRIELRLTTP
ncbi:OmpA family protein [Benzoatithermus flavus]|uniref:OmpA family protein n=1 Tax=Benzoatithermus flavus TaxID=3108223 RepID=A0ABU8XMX3_9PROT